MKFEMMDNDCLPAIEVVTEGDELVVRYWGFSCDEAKRWFDSEPVMNSLKVWHSVIGDFGMSVNVFNKNWEALGWEKTLD